MLSFDIKGNESTAFKFLNNIKLIKLAVSLGSTESLAEHPNSMTHADVDESVRDEMGITEKMVRLSIGVENYKTSYLISNSSGKMHGRTADYHHLICLMA